MTSPATQPIPSAKDIPKAWAAADREEAFWKEHAEEFLQKFRDHFVVVYDGEVIASSPDLNEVFGVIQTMGISPRAAWIRYISAGRRTMLL